MKPGHAGTVVVLVAGAVLGGAVVAKDGAQLGRAKKLLGEGESSLAAGKTKDAQTSFREALGSALVVGGITGRRPAALDVAGEARRGLRVCEAVLLAERGDPMPLDVIDEAAARGGPAKETLDKLVTKELARQQELTAEALEKIAVETERRPGEPCETRAELHDIAEKAYLLAQDAIKRTGAEPEARITRGAGRSHARALVQHALAANAADKGVEARKFADAGTIALKESADAFDMPEDSPSGGVKERQALEAFVRGITAEGRDRELVNAFEKQVAALDARVDTRDLGVLLPDVSAVKEPTLEGHHRGAAELTTKIAVAKARLDKIRETAEQFQGMVLAVEGATKVYIDRHEVTNAEFKKFFEEKHPYGDGKTADVWGSEATVNLVDDFMDSKAKDLGPATWVAGSFAAGTDEHPVAGVCAVEARAYARARGKRLPTYDEWKAAAGVTRGTPVPAYPWGEQWRDGGGNVQLGSTANGTKPVGQFAAGRASTGADDLIGNVRELVDDVSSVLAVGGSYESKPDAATLRSALRVKAEDRPRDQGFRCAKELTWQR